MQSEIRAACIQVLFSAVYHLKAVVLPYSSDLLKLSLKALRSESEKVIESILAQDKQLFWCCWLCFSTCHLEFIDGPLFLPYLCAHPCMHLCSCVRTHAKAHLSVELIIVLVKGLGAVNKSRDKDSYAKYSYIYHLTRLHTIVNQERMAGAKLVASLMASDDMILGSISGALIEARSMLSTVSLTDPSQELRQVCKQLVMCMTSTWVGLKHFSRIEDHKTIYVPHNYLI